jgi:hypothetical protein
MTDTLGQVLSILKTTPLRWLQMAEKISPELFCRAPAPGEWSAHECLQHIIDTERMVFPARVGYLLRGEDFPAFNPEDNGSKSSIETSSYGFAKEFERLRKESIEILKKIKPDDLKKKARHQELGIVSLGEMINEWAGHDLMHTIQAEKAIMQVFIEGCPSWREYFKEHIIEG